MFLLNKIGLNLQLSLCVFVFVVALSVHGGCFDSASTHANCFGPAALPLAFPQLEGEERAASPRPEEEGWNVARPGKRWQWVLCGFGRRGSRWLCLFVCQTCENHNEPHEYGRGGRIGRKDDVCIIRDTAGKVFLKGHFNALQWVNSAGESEGNINNNKSNFLTFIVFNI